MSIYLNIYLIIKLFYRFVTLTPISEDDSRHDIPDNLKLFFRPVAMTMPDVEVVAGVLLYSMGFKHLRYVIENITNVQGSKLAETKK